MEEIEFLEEWEASLFLKFLDDMLPTSFSWQSFKKHNFRVFWSAEKASIDHDFSIQDQIKTALSAFNSFSCFESNDVLIQFWAASMTEDGRRLLTTSDQPFAINYLPDEKLMKYKKDCPKYKFVGEGEEDHNLTDDGPVSRVFRTQLQELSPNLSYYSVKEYPERDLALGCGFEATLVLPVFEPTLHFCVGVLELLSPKYKYTLLIDHIYCARKILKNIATGFRAYVLEFFLPPDKSHSVDLHNFLSSILTTLKQHLKTFKVVTGDIGNDLFTEIGYLNESNAEANNTSFTSFHTISSFSTSSGHETTSSSRSIESTMNSTRRKLNNYTGPSVNLWIVKLDLLGVL